MNGDDLLEIKHIVSSSESFRKGYCDFLYIEDKYILENGVLINSDGELEWSVPWEHGYFSAKYLKERHVIFTDRVAMPGPVTVDLGNCCISMETGNYLWKNWYDNDYDERMAIINRQPDIKLESGFRGIEPNGEFLWSKDFRVNINDGSAEYKGGISKEERAEINATLIRPFIFLDGVPSYTTTFTDEKRPIKFGIHEVTIDNKTFSKEGYFFNKCNAIIPIEQYLFFFAAPARRNTKGAILFKYSLELKDVVEEIELPFRNGPKGVYNFFNRGIMIYETTKNHKIWLINNQQLRSNWES